MTEQFEISDLERLARKPRVSVLVLAYKHAEFLQECLASIVDQNVDFPFEIIVGEDKSPDGTFEIATKFQLDHPALVRVISAPRNVGMQGNLRRLVSAARAPILAYCEGDDFWVSRSKLAEQVAILETDTDAVAVHSDFVHVKYINGGWRGLDGFNKREGRSIPEGRVFENLLVGNFIQTCTLAIRTDVVREYLDSTLPVDSYLVGDWPQCLYASLQGKIVYLDKVLSAYRSVPGSATNSGIDAEYRRAQDAGRMTSDFVELIGAPANFRSAGVINEYQHVLNAAYSAGDRRPLRKAMKVLREADPVNRQKFSVALRISSRVPGVAHVVAAIRRSRAQRRDHAAYLCNFDHSHPQTT